MGRIELQTPLWVLHGDGIQHYMPIMELVGVEPTNKSLITDLLSQLSYFGIKVGSGSPYSCSVFCFHIQCG